MTSKRRIKKEIDYVVSDLILDCMTYTILYQKPNDSEADQIIQGTMILRNELRDLANHPEKRSDDDSVKSHYDNIGKTLVGGIEEGYGQLRKLISSEKQN
jgi:hypothetical protein